MTIAFAVWENRISPLFDTAGRLLLAEVANGQVTGRRYETLADVTPVEKVSRLGQLGVEVLVCGAISQPLATMIAGEGIRLVPFVAGGVEEVLDAYVRGMVPGPAFAMPGCGRRRRGRFGRGCRRGGRGRGRARPGWPPP